MRDPGDLRPPQTTPPARSDPTQPAGSGQDQTATHGGTARTRAIALGLLVIILAALSWALLRAILELGVGLVAVAFLGGWGIGAVVRSAGASPVVAMVLAVLAWLLGLVLTWLIALAILPGSSRSFLERVEGTPFTDWMSPQFGLLEVVGLLAYVGVAGYASRRGRSEARDR